MYKLKPSSMSRKQYDLEMQFYKSEEERAAACIDRLRRCFVNEDLLDRFEESTDV